MSYPVPSAPIISGSTRPARRLGAALALCAAALLASGCEILSLGERQPEPVRDEAAPEARGPPYDVAFSGLEDIGLEGLFRQTSQLIALAERPPATQAGLRRRAEEDLERLRSVLRSEGYYAGTLGYEIDTTAEPQIVHIEAEPRARYSLAEVTINYQVAVEADANLPRGPEDLGLEIGMPARAPAILEAQSKLINYIRNLGYPFASIIDRKTIVRRDEAVMRVEFEVDTGPQARFGSVTIENSGSVRDDYVRDLLDWQEGESFSQSIIDASRRALISSGLFASVKFRPGQEVGPDGRLPMTVSVVEKKHRTIGFGAKFASDEGFEINGFWEHRNIFGRAEQLGAKVTLAEIEQSLSADLRKPGFWHRDQSLLGDVALTRRDSDAFQETGLAGFIGLERTIGETWRLTGGFANEYSILDDDEGERTFLLFGLPATARRNTSDNLLNPSRGTRLGLSVTPWFGTIEENLAFISATASGAAYYALDHDARFILAGRAKIGSIVGTETETLPANKRFYAGGGGSVRGYEFEKLGPLDSQNDPLGGRSVIELGGELRARVTESVGLVPFIDGGTVSDAAYPDFQDDFLWAAGLGLRYFTAIGPLRLDVAVPINGRDVDDDYQFYISIGQAF